MKNILKPSLNWLLVFVPATVALEFMGTHSPTLLFITSCLAILPLAGWLGRATEHLAERTGESIGGLLNATFGNAAELIIALMALHKGLYGVVKASLTGSIIGNILLVMGAAIFAGGLKYKTQQFNAAGARTHSTMLLLAAVSLVMPAAYHYLGGPQGWGDESDLSLEISVILLLVYAASLYFSLRTHKQFFTSHPAEAAAGESEGGEVHKPWSVGVAVGVLAGATALIAWMSEILVASVDVAAEQFGMTSVFVGVIVVAVVGNAAEHSTAILVARQNRMDLSLGIAVGSSLQIALFVAPVLVILSHFVGPTLMDLVFTPAEVLAVVIAIAISTQVSSDGESNWLEGLQLLAVYMIMAIVFYFLPETGPKGTHP